LIFDDDSIEGNKRVASKQRMISRPSAFETFPTQTNIELFSQLVKDIRKETNKTHTKVRLRIASLACTNHKPTSNKLSRCPGRSFVLDE